MHDNDEYILTGAEALHLLELTVKEHGADFVYQRPIEHSSECYYNWDGQPSCVVGHVFANYVGIEVPDDMENIGVDSYLFRVPGVRITPEAHQVLGVAQNEQDLGRPWGEAYAEAEARARQIGVVE